MNDLDLGWNELPASTQASPFAANAAPLTHPVLKVTGVTKITIQDRNASRNRAGLTIFSGNGATLRHVGITVKRCEDVIIRNLKFDHLWEWDEATKGKYDKQDWDFLTLEDNNRVWVDHCEFGKVYDGVLDIKVGSKNTTISWCKFTGDSGQPGSFVWQQINAMEADPTSYPMYKYFRDAGLTPAQIVEVARSQKKGHLIGSTEFEPTNANLWVTIHHNVYWDIQDRLPRLRAGNVHVYNIYANATAALAAKRMRETFTNANSSTYSFGVTSNGAISTENGAVLVEKSHLVDIISPLRNNQVDPAQTTFTGKIKAVDTIYALDGATYRGDSTAENSPLTPEPATPLTFSWNGLSELPYSGQLVDDPADLASSLTGPTGAGAGTLNWEKGNWLKTAY